MLDLGSSQQNPAVSKIDIFLGSAMSVTLVVIGVSASKMSEPFFLGLLIVLACFLAVLQYVTWLRSRSTALRSELERHLSDRSNLLSVLTEITAHCKNNQSFTKTDFLVAIRWWWEEDLWSDYHLDLEIEEEFKVRTVGKDGWRRRMRHPIEFLRRSFWSVRVKLISAERPHLIEVVHAMPNEEVARVVISRALQEEFIEELLVAGNHISLTRIEYVWTDTAVTGS